MILTSSGQARFPSTHPIRKTKRKTQLVLPKCRPFSLLSMRSPCTCSSSSSSSFLKEPGYRQVHRPYHSAYHKYRVVLQVVLICSGDITAYQTLGMVSMLSQPGCGMGSDNSFNVMAIDGGSLLHFIQRLILSLVCLWACGLSMRATM